MDLVHWENLEGAGGEQAVTMEGIRVSPVSTCFYLNVQTPEFMAQPLSEWAGATRILQVPVLWRRGVERRFRALGYRRGEAGWSKIFF